MSRKKLNKACAICHPKNRYCEALASASRINLYWWNSNSTLIFKLWSLISSALNLTPFTFHLKAFYFALVFSLFALSAQAQTYPVQVNPVLLPPYSLNTSDYIMSSSDFDNVLNGASFQNYTFSPSAAGKKQFTNGTVPRIILYQTSDGRKGAIKVKQYVSNGNQSYIVVDIKVQKTP